jgi:hypothetical protein
MESFFSLLQKNVLTANAGRPEKNCGWRSSPGSNAPTTADAVPDRRPGAGVLIRTDLDTSVRIQEAVSGCGR